MYLKQNPNLSMTTLRGGGGIRLPAIVITLRPIRAGVGGGISRTTSG